MPRIWPVFMPGMNFEKSPMFVPVMPCLISCPTCKLKSGLLSCWAGNCITLFLNFQVIKSDNNLLEFPLLGTRLPVRNHKVLRNS